MQFCRQFGCRKHQKTTTIGPIKFTSEFVYRGNFHNGRKLFHLHHLLFQFQSGHIAKPATATKTIV